MLWFSMVELDTLISIILLIMYGLLGLRSRQVLLADTYAFVRILPLVWVISLNGSYSGLSLGSYSVFGVEVLLALCVVLIMPAFKGDGVIGVRCNAGFSNSLEASLLLLLGFIFQYYMLHSVDVITFFITLEAQNFAFFVLCGMLPFAYANKGNISMSIEVSLKYLLLSAFSSGVLLYGSSLLYVQTGSTSLASVLGQLSIALEGNLLPGIPVYMVLCAILFKLGVAPFHLWMYQLYGGTHRSIVLYITTIPKLCIIAFWIEHLQGIVSNYSLILFSLLSGLVGSTAYTQPSIRYLLVYSSISEIGLLIAALETAGHNALMLHLSIYIVSQYLLWNVHNAGSQVNRVMPLLAVSLAGIPPLAGFFGKAWIFWHLGTYSAIVLLVFSLLYAFVSIVFYIRLIRLSYSTESFTVASDGPRINGVAYGRTYLTAACVVLLLILPMYILSV